MTPVRVFKNDFIAVCKDSYVIYACGFDWMGKLEWFAESKRRYNYRECAVCVMTSFGKMTLQAPATLVADGIISD